MINIVKVKEDLTGKRFGRLTVIEQAEDHVSKSGNHYAKWKCQCDCGNTVCVDGYKLKSGNTKSCGCYMSECNSKRCLKDLAGQRFGKLFIIKRVEDYKSPQGRHEAQWLCKCDCGNEKIVRSSSLKQKLVTSCGCYRKEMAIKRLVLHNKKYNTYDLSGEYGIGYTECGKEFYFDLEDYDKIKDYYWNAKDSNDNHIIGSVNGTKTSLHRFLMNVNSESNLVVDHINTHCPEDNRKKNLRIVTMSENQMNRKLAKNNTSGITGVVWSKKDNLWIAQIGLNNQKIIIGYFKNFNDAVKVRKEAEEKYFGEYSYDNSQKKWGESCNE